MRSPQADGDEHVVPRPWTVGGLGPFDPPALKRALKPSSSLVDLRVEAPVVGDSGGRGEVSAASAFLGTS